MTADNRHSVKLPEHRQSSPRPANVLYFYDENGGWEACFDAVDGDVDALVDDLRKALERGAAVMVREARPFD